MGAFLLVSVTGILMFFHLHRGFNKLAHEWLSWAMILGVSLHVMLNLASFKRYFTQTTGRAILAIFVLLLALSFMEKEKKGGDPSYAQTIRALANAPLSVLVQVGGISFEDAKIRLEASGNKVINDQQSISELVGEDFRKQTNTIKEVLAPVSR
jgi:Domain of unknown function (DUF4405)